MDPQGKDLEIELELEQLRQAMEMDLKLEQLPEAIAAPLAEQLAQTEADDRPEGSPNPVASPSSRKPKAFIAAIALLGLAVGGSAIAALKVQQWALTTSTTIGTEIETAKKKVDIDLLKQHRQTLQTATAILEKTPNLRGFNYQQAQANLPLLRSLQTTVQLNLTATERLKLAETLAMEAAVLVQNPPHPLEVWAKAREKWQEAIGHLQSISPDSIVSSTAKQKLSSYQTNLTIINQRMATAQKAVGFNNRGAAEISKRDYRRAIQYFNQAISLNASQPEAYIGQGIAYSELGNNLQAIQHYDKAIQLNSNFAEAYYNRGLSHYELGNEEKALEDYNLAIQNQPNYAQAYLERGGAHYALKDPSAAMADFQQSAQLFSQQGDKQNHELAQKIIDYLQATTESNLDESDHADYQECWDAWGNPCNEIHYYVPPRTSKNSGGVNVPNPEENSNSIRTPSRTRGGSFRSRRRR
ncbi:tetratricopeptide repeat protein [Laspinema olomoucense]|uniref:tetratricopeptide repeat protein n=1 Tax=Laspinema olomoucense TaxID=3231600 RepID=UPI0021BAF671|nr:tetratricopeptide repeat protein [Laspinema sp. D3a]MCT7991853.1 tetratricopeptide repeat protein [Laspinema sp. D3a]